jgi:D-alanine-D-alanine ligase
MRVAIVFNQVQASASAAELDVLRQVQEVEAALYQLGHRVDRVPCRLDLEQLRTSMTALQPDVVFNLVEALSGSDRLMAVPPLMLESLRVPCTGGSAAAILATSDKVRAKRRMRQVDLPTPAWRTSADSNWQSQSAERPTPERFIIKAIGEHASLGLSPDSVLNGANVTMDRLADVLLQRERDLKVPHFAEEFVAGREFNLSLLASPDGVEVLPLAEVQFLHCEPDSSAAIVDHDAKWSEGSTAWVGTPRRFDFPQEDEPLLTELKTLARRCWDVFELRGWARVDFRVDRHGRPWILEINVNPCLSSDAGFCASAKRAGLSFADVVQRIVDDAGVGR